MNYRLKASLVFTEDGIIKDGEVLVDNGIIISASNAAGKAGKAIDLRPLTLVPGFVDIHTHGAAGFDVMDCSYEALNNFSLAKAAEGVTSFCPTVITAAPEDMMAAACAVQNAKEKGVEGARIIGAFMEGPFISHLYKGAHKLEYIRDINNNELEQWASLGICSVAIAPELPGALEAIALLKDRNVNVRIGHSNADYEKACAAINRGANIGIHLYNAMCPLAHRQPGMVGALLDKDSAFCEIICDLEHVHPAAIRLMLRCKGHKQVILITDSICAAGLKDGSYNLGGLSVFVQNGVCRLKDGTLAGSTLRMNDAVKNMYQTVGESLYNAVWMASTAPARAIGLQNVLGSIKHGKYADLVGLDENCRVSFLMIGGKIKI